MEYLKTVTQQWRFLKVRTDNMKNVLITSAGKRVVLVKIFQHTLRESGFDAKVFTTDMRPEMAPAGIVSDGCFDVPRCSDAGFVDAILNICRENNIGVIIPTIDPELLVFSENKQLFEENDVKLMLSDTEFIRICRDKRLTSTFFEQIGIPVPKMLDKRHPVFPMFAKPYDGSLSTNIHIIKNADNLTREILDDPKLLFMEYIDKSEYKEFTVDMYFGLDHKVKSIVPRERIEIRAGEINKGITRKNYIVDFLKDRMGYLPGIRGCICVQLFYRDTDNDIKGIEINPRFGGGYPLSYHAKANYADFVIREYLLGENLEYSANWLNNTLMLRYDKDVVVYDQKVVAFDLDDTLYKEVDYLKSAYREIAEKLELKYSIRGVYDFLWNKWSNGDKDPFGRLIEEYELNVSKEDLIQCYRNHIPSITLEQDIADLLSKLKASGIILCLITDGRSLTQRNKILALGLDRFIDNENIFISEEIGTNKYSPKSFEILNSRYPDALKIYVGDNCEKDFYWPNALGWNTICIKNEQDNIHPFRQVSQSKSPKYIIEKLSEVMELINNNENNQMYRNKVVKRIAVYGAGGLGREVAGGIQRINKANKEQWEFVGFYDDNLEVGTKVSHYGTVMGGMDELNALDEPLALAIAVGNAKVRKLIHERISNPNIYFPNLIAPSFKVLDPETFTIGQGNIIQDSCSATCDVKIGDFNVFNGANVLGHDVVIGDYNVFMPSVHLSGAVEVGNCNMLGVDSVVLQKVKIGNEVTLGAGSVLMTKPKDGSTYIGVPAKKFDFE